MAMTAAEYEAFDRLKTACYDLAESVVRVEEELAALDRIATQAEQDRGLLAEVVELRERLAALEKSSKPKRRRKPAAKVY